MVSIDAQAIMIIVKSFVERNSFGTTIVISHASDLLAYLAGSLPTEIKSSNPIVVAKLKLLEK